MPRAPRAPRAPRQAARPLETTTLSPQSPQSPLQSSTTSTPETSTATPTATSTAPPGPRRPRPLSSSTSPLSPTSPLYPISPWPPDPSSAPSRQSSPSPRPDTRPYATAARDGVPSLETLPSAKEISLPSAKEVYGSIAVLLTYLAFAAYLSWAVLPASSLEQVGWTWFPAQEWAVIVPCWLMVVVLLAYWSYAGITAWLTPALDSSEFITDSHSRVPEHQHPQDRYYHALAHTQGLPEAIDLPIDVVNRVLYPPRPKRPR